MSSEMDEMQGVEAKRESQAHAPQMPHATPQFAIYGAPRLDLTYEINARLERLVALLPVCGAHLAVVSGNELCSLDLAEELLGVTTDAVVLDLGHLDLALGIHHERAAVSHARLLDHHAESA